MTKTGKKKLWTEEAAFEVELPKKYDTIEKFAASKDYLMIVSQMSRNVREEFFSHFDGCEKFQIVDRTCIGGRCFIAIKFWYEDWIDKIEVTDASKIGEKSDE